MSKTNRVSAQGLPRITRRHFLYLLAGVGGAGAVHHGMEVLGLVPTPAAQAAIPHYPPDIGQGKKVIVIGAGLAGLCAAYHLAHAGFEVKVIEANPRAGGRSLTVRPGDKFHERNQPDQECKFTDPNLYLNAGPGRIPQHHTRVLNYCQEFDVELEPFIFIGHSNLLQHDDLNEGKPVLFRQLQNNLRGHVAELLAKVPSDALDEGLSDEERRNFVEMLRNFGDLEEDLRYGTAVPLDQCPSERRGTERAGYAREDIVEPSERELLCSLGLNDITESGLWAEVFNHLRYYWQSTLLQPVGGMDMIWKAFLNQEIPGGHTLNHQVTLGSPVTKVRNLSNNQVEVTHGYGDDEMVDVADFCISTMTPKQLKNVGDGFSSEFDELLGKFPYIASCKVGWQADERFWEIPEKTNNQPIFGGISWIKHIISQVWYPSDGFHSDTGVLTAAYNRDAPLTGDTSATDFGNLSLAERFEKAYEGGEKLHPGHYRANINPDTALSVAWQHMPYFEGGWQDHAATQKPNTDYQKLLDWNRTGAGQIFLAGDYLSYVPGWQEGSFASAEWVVERIIERVRQ